MKIFSTTFVLLSMLGSPSVPCPCQTTNEAWPMGMASRAPRPLPEFKKAGKTPSGSQQSGQPSGLVVRHADPSYYASTPDGGFRILTEAEIEALQRETDAYFSLLKEAGSALDSGRLGPARSLLEATLSMKMSQSGLVLLADTYLREGKHDKAYTLLAPFVHTFAGRDILLLASLAAAKRGEVYEGQADYCIKSILLYHSSREESVLKILPKARDARTLEFLSSLALAVKFGSTLNGAGFHHYMSLALEIKPTDVFANFHAADMFIQKKDYLSAKRSLHLVQERGNGFMSGFVKRKLDRLPK